MSNVGIGGEEAEETRVLQNQTNEEDDQVVAPTSTKACFCEGEISASRAASRAQYLKVREKRKWEVLRDEKDYLFRDVKLSAVETSKLNHKRNSRRPVAITDDYYEMPPADDDQYPEEHAIYRSAKYKELEGLIGSKRGDTAKGMNEVKKILNKRGYMDAYNPQEDDNDNFDEKLQAAISVYHYYYRCLRGISPGIIDCEFLGLLTDDRPRCGFESCMHARDKKFKMGYYAEDKTNNTPYQSQESEEEFQED